MGTLSRELREGAAHTKGAGVAATVAHVQRTGLDVMLRVDSLAAGAPRLWTKQLVTRALLQMKSERKKSRQCVLRKSSQVHTFKVGNKANLQTPGMTLAQRWSTVNPHPPQKDPHTHRLEGRPCGSCRTLWGWPGVLHFMKTCFQVSHEEVSDCQNTQNAKDLWR